MSLSSLPPPSSRPLLSLAYITETVLTGLLASLSSDLQPFSIPQVPSVKNHLLFRGSALPLNESPISLPWPMRLLHYLLYWPHYLQPPSPTPPSTSVCSPYSVSLIFSPGVYAVLSAQNILALPFAWTPNSTFNFAYVSGLHVPRSEIGVAPWHTINTCFY